MLVHVEALFPIARATETGIEPESVELFFIMPQFHPLFSFIPPPDYKLPPEKLGYLRHMTPGPKQVMPDNFHVESIHLRHAY